MSIYAERLQAVQAQIHQMQTNLGSNAQNVMLLAVSKTQSASIVREVFDAGQRAFGENYVQEAIDKQAELTELAIEWHFIGPIQSNKTQLIAKHFDWVHGVDRLKIAQRLSTTCQEINKTLNICLQVNISGEASKSGVAPEAVLPLLTEIHALPQLRIRGLMAIPEPTQNVELQRERFKSLRLLKESLQAAGYPMDTLSMGMSEDFGMAIQEGATIVRIGSAIFGARPSKQTSDTQASIGK